MGKDGDSTRPECVGGWAACRSLTGHGKAA